MNADHGYQRIARLPIITVILALIFLLLFPYLLHSRVDALRRHIDQLTQPAQALVADIRQALGLESVALRGYMITGDSVYAAAYLQARSTRDRASQRLHVLIDSLGPPTNGALAAFQERLRPADERAAAILSVLPDPEQVREQLPAREQALLAADTAAARLEDLIKAESAERYRQIAVYERRLDLLRLGLIALALVSVAMLVRLGAGYRELARSLEQRVHDEAMLRQLGRQLSEATNVVELLQVVADSAIDVSRAIGAYVERILTPGAGGQVEVVAVAGDGTPPVRTRVPYPGSLTEKVIDSGEAEVMTEISSVGESIAPYLLRSCRHCTGLLVPLQAGGEVLGALVLLRNREQGAFSDDELTHARVLGDLASAALRRTRLVEALTESEGRFRQIADNLHEVIWLANADFSERYYVNPAWEEIWGLSRDVFYHNPEQAVDCVHPDDRSRFESALKDLLEGKFDIKFRIIRPDGEIRWVWSRANAVRDGSGRIFRIAGIIEDITRARHAEQERERLLLAAETSHRKLVTVLESITDSFCALDRDWRFTYVNREAERVLNRSRNELLGKNAWEEYPTAAVAEIRTEFERALAEQSSVELEAYLDFLGGWIEIRAFASEEGLSVFFRDVTERRRIQQELLESERNFRALGNSIPQLAWMAHPDGRIIWFNQRWYEYTGITPEEGRDWGWRLVVHPEHADRVERSMREAMARGEPWEDTFPLRGITGEYRWFLSRALPIRDAQGRVSRWFGTNTDVTDRIQVLAERERLLEREREARAEADRRREELEKVTESRSRLMRGFSHDLKNPLGAADGYLQLLEDGIPDPLTGKQQESVGKVRRSIRTALALIEDLLALARAEAGQLEMERAPAEPGRIVSEAMEEYRAQAEARGLEFRLDLSPDLPRIISDAKRIRQIVGNLLSNAVKYTRSGSITVRSGLLDSRKPAPPLAALAAQAPAAGRWVVVSVADTGPGIPRQEQELLFQEFRRLGTAGETRGAGIGLAISRRLARALGGEISVESEVGRGSTFSLWLPA